ncbi:hypothetical protein Tco_1072433 [Tanacetum coccineum]
MSQPANDEFSQHLSDDEESNHEDASDTGAASKQQQQVIQNGNSKKIISTGKDGIVRILPPVTAAEIQAVEKEKEGGEGFRKGIMTYSQQLLSQLGSSWCGRITEDANHSYPIIGPRAWVFEQEIQGASKTFSSAQNVAFVSQSKSNTNKVKSGAYSTCTPTSSTNIPEKEAIVGFADEVIYSLFTKQSEDWDLLHEDLEQIDDLDIEEMDINWQIAMIAIRMKKLYKKTGRRVRVDGKAPVGFDKKKLECFNVQQKGHMMERRR